QWLPSRSLQCPAHLTEPTISATYCSSVYYSLLSACAMCQGSSLDTFTVWTQGCPQVNISMGTGTIIPPWAFLPLSGESFDLIAAGRNATGDADFGHDSPALSTAAIVGLTLGSVAALLLVIAAIWLYCKTFAARTNYGQVHTSSQNSNSERSRVRYDKIEGPPRKPYNFMSRPKVVSYRP
ncbi:16113_t:CDS:2, partial [Acaulospora colombiana]